MKSLSQRRFWLVLPVYAFLGLTLGLADGLLGRCAQQLGVRPGWATAIVVNGVFPLSAVMLAILVPRLSNAYSMNRVPCN